MAKSIDEQIALAVEKAVEKTMERIVKKFDKEIGAIVKKHLASMERMGEASMDGDSLVTLQDAAKILGVNLGKIRKLSDSGEIRKVTPPGCRGKILRSSLDGYIKRLIAERGNHGEKDLHRLPGAVCPEEMEPENLLQGML